MSIDSVIFDLDGTLCNSNHRMNFINAKPKNWPAFFAGIPNDTPHELVRTEAMRLAVSHYLLIVTARPVSTRTDTLDWLKKYEINFQGIYFRENGDYRSAVEVKSDIYQQILKDGYPVPLCAYDDSIPILEMFRQQNMRETILVKEDGSFDFYHRT